MTTLLSRLRGGFLGDVLKLTVGTLAGRLITLAALPVVTRIYSPQDFALLAVYLALVSTLAAAACLRLEVAIPLAQTDSDAADTLVLALTVLALVTALLTVPALLVPSRIARLLGAPELSHYLWLVPVGVAMTGSYSALQFWASRTRRFAAIARTRIGQAATGISAMVVLGLLGFAPFGLLLGNMLSIGAGGVSLAVSALANDRTLLRTVRLRNLIPALRGNQRYALFATPDALLNIAGIQIPVLMIATYTKTEAGFLLLAMQVMTGPMTLLGSSISQVYVSRAPVTYSNGQLAPFTLSIMRRLVLIGVGPLILAGTLAPVIFPLLFGAKWAPAGDIVIWLVPWMILQFIASPVSMVMYVVGRQRAMLLLTMLGLVMRVGGVLIAIDMAVVSPILGFVMGSIVYYITVNLFVIAAAGFDNRQQLSLLVSFGNWRVVVPTAVAAILAYVLW